MTVLNLEDRRKPEEFKGSLPMTRMLNDLSRIDPELADDWLFQNGSPEVKRRMLIERRMLAARGEKVAA